MNALREDEKFVINSIAKAFAGEWRCGENPPDAYLTCDTKTFAVEISTLTQPITDEQGHIHSRLSDDHAARRFVAALNADARLQNVVPSGCTIGLVLSSPILKKPSTKSSLVKIITGLLANPASLASDHVVRINDNNITIYLIRHDEVDSPKVSGIYPHRGSNPDVLANVKIILEDRITTKSEKCDHLRAAGPLWLALLNDYWLASAYTYRHAMSSLSIMHPFEKILLVGGSGAVDQLYPPV
jgi:hypothetical protein